ncbi:hypothetical protein BJX61DRAFT_535645 [Aspergillus egyptiacus]|nr:hypothetical protein BJX61DRAFT_535645 [Aspergillus egyptiacus]
MNGVHGIGLGLILLALFTSTYAHSWVEQLMVIAPNGAFDGSPGYPRGNVFRTDPAFNDDAMVHLLPPPDKPTVTATDNLCRDTQRKQEQTNESPRLQASAGAAIALRFQENGHVTIPLNTPGKPENRGRVYVYGTADPREDEKLLDVHKVWNKAGTGGDGRGVLLAIRDYDDGRCYQVNNEAISQYRQTEFPHEPDQYMGADLWCQADIALPANAPTGKPYTLYWVWDWPTMPGIDPNLPNGKQEIYTTCMDVDVIGHSGDRTDTEVKYNPNQSLNSASIPDQFEEIFSSVSKESSAATTTKKTTTSSSTLVTSSTLITSPAPGTTSSSSSTFTTFVTQTSTP